MAGLLGKEVEGINDIDGTAVQQCRRGNIRTVRQTEGVTVHILIGPDYVATRPVLAKRLAEPDLLHVAIRHRTISQSCLRSVEIVAQDEVDDTGDSVPTVDR